MENKKQKKKGNLDAPKIQPTRVTQLEIDKDFVNEVMKFTDSIVITTSADCNDTFVWEPKTRAMIDVFKEDSKFRPGTLCSLTSSGSYVVATHTSKAIFTVWKWGQNQPLHRFSSRDEITSLRFFGEGLYCIAGTVKGDIIMWQVNTGEIIADFCAHFGGATSSLDVSHRGDLVLSAGIDAKLKLWSVKELLQQQPVPMREMVGHTGSIICVQINPPATRGFSCSTDKSFKIWDLGCGMLIKTIQIQANPVACQVDLLESFVYIACSNQNIYCNLLENENQQVLSPKSSSQKKKIALTHRSQLSCMALSHDNIYLISGTKDGIIYIWSTDTKTLIHNLEIHKDKGPINNILSLYRPLNLYGLNANLKAITHQHFEPFEKFQGAKKTSKMGKEDINEMQVVIEPTIQDESDDEEDLDFILSRTAGWMTQQQVEMKQPEGEMISAGTNNEQLESSRYRQTLMKTLSSLFGIE